MDKMKKSLFIFLNSLLRIKKITYFKFQKEVKIRLGKLNF